MGKRKVKRLFLDTNIIIDFLGNREPFGKFAKTIFKKGYNGEVELWTSDNSITTTYYILTKIEGEEKARRLISKLLDKIEVQPVTKTILISALSVSFSDYEDAVQYLSAKSIRNLDAIVTRNKKDFKASEIEVLSSEELF
jgi:predicted nucleic acid-binding protein